MDSVVSRLFFMNWQRKLVALIIALVVWLLVSHSITDTKTIPNVPVRIVNLPADKTIRGLLPNGILSRRVSLTISGSKDVIRELEPGDLEVLLDASLADSDEWVVQINKKNLVSLNPSVDLTHHISNVSHSDFVVKMTKLLTTKIPVTVMHPIGEAPPGYEYLDIWPQKLMQTVSGPEEEINDLKVKGLEIVFDLKDITKADLDAIRQAGGAQSDEISYPVPVKWKMVGIPFHNNALEELNDLDAYQLHIDFLRKGIIEVGRETPIHVFYPLKYSQQLNPYTTPLGVQDRIVVKNDIPVFSQTLYVKDVSRLFIDVIKENLSLVILAAPKSERENLQWSFDVVDASELEDHYVAYNLSSTTTGKSGLASLPNKKRESVLRTRFRLYLQKLILYSSPEQRLNLEAKIDQNKIIVK